MCLSSLFALLLTSNTLSHYKGALNSSDRPLALIGKGITFDSGGITLKQGDGMKLMRSDMGGAAAVVSAALAIAKLKIPYAHPFVVMSWSTPLVRAFDDMSHGLASM